IPNDDKSEHSNGDANVMSTLDINSSHPIDEDATFATSLNENTNIFEGRQSDSISPRSNNEGQISTNIEDEPQTMREVKHALGYWNEKLTSGLNENGFVQSINDYSLFVKHDNGVVLALLVYVDDIVPILFSMRKKHFEIDMHLVREKDAFDAISTIKIDSAKNDHVVFTKGLSISRHKQFCLQLNMVDIFRLCLIYCVGIEIVQVAFMGPI
nr:ribonuclease H-like domain-containing protein [Tanacetum cinerariifolium]